MRIVLGGLAVGTSAVLFAACGSSSATDLFGAQSAAVDAGLDGAIGSGNPETPAGDGGTAATDAGKRPKDAGTPVDTDAGVTPVDAGLPTDEGIFCGLDPDSNRLYCPAGSQACCIRSVSGQLAFDCKPASGPTSSCVGLRVPCSDQVDCGGKACCATYDQISGGYKDVSCKTSCGSSTATTTEFRLCDPNASADECAAIGKSCQASTAIDGWYLCK